MQGEFKVMQTVWDDIIKENYFDFDRLFQLYEYKESTICPEDLKTDLNDIFERVQQLSQTLDGINLDAKKEMNSVRPLLRSLSDGVRTSARTSSNNILKLFEGYKRYRAILLECYEVCKPNLKTISSEVNDLLGELVDVTHKGLEMANPIDTTSIEPKRKNILTKLDNIRSFISAFLKCTQKAVVVYRKVQDEFNVMYRKIRSSL